MRCAVLALTVLSLPQHVSADCKNAYINTALKIFNVSGLDALPNALLKPLQTACAKGNCPKVPTPCGNQSVDNIDCEIPVFKTDVTLVADPVCNTACNDWPCRVACDGINDAACNTADFFACKVRCLGIHRCVHRCEKLIVAPCKKILVDTCDAACDGTFQACKNLCDSVLTMGITGKLEKFENVISSLAVPNFDVDCHGDGIARPVIFNASFVGLLGDLDLAVQIQTNDAGIRTTDTISLDHITATLHLPVSGSIQCGLGKKRRNIDVTFGDAVVTDFGLDVTALNKAVSTISAVICLGLPFCRDAIQDGIDGAIKGLIMQTVPNVVASVISPTLQSLVSGLACPSIGDEEPDEEPEVINVINV